MQGQLNNVKLRGSTTTTPGGRWGVDLDQVGQLNSFGSELFVYLAVILLELTLVITNNSGGGVTVQWEKLYDVVVGVDLNFKAANKHLWEFTQAGGQAVWQTFYQKYGRFPDVQTDVSINNGASATLYLVLPITFYDPRCEEPEDELLWGDLLAQSTIDFTYGAAGTYGAGVTFTVTPNVSIYCVPRNDRRFPTMVRHTEEALTSFTRDNLSVNNYYPMDVVVMPYNASAGQSMKAFAAADFTSVKLTYDGAILINVLNPTTIVKYRNLEALSSGDRLGQWEAGSNLRLDLAWFDGRENTLKSKIMFASSMPQVEFVGGGGTTVNDFRMLYRLVIPSGRATAQTAFSAIGLAIPTDKITPRTSNGADVRDRSIMQVIPWSIAA